MRKLSLEKYDVAIIGGGLAGLSTAFSIGKKVGTSLLLVEKSVIGDPTKTSPFTFQDTVKHFDLSEAVLQKYKRFTYRSPTGVAASFIFKNPVFVTIDYQRACNIILDRIRKECSIDVLEKTEALDLKPVEKPSSTTMWKLALSNSTHVLCSVLVDASGSSFFALAKLRIKPPTLYSHAYGEYLEGCEIKDPEEMCIFAGNEYGNGGGWLYPIDRNTARFGFASVTRSRIYPRHLVIKNFRKAIQHFSPYNGMLNGAKRRRSELGTIPIGPLERFVYKRLLIVGDAAGQATSWYNEGIRPALESGELCGKIIAEAYKGGVFHEPILSKYQSLWDTKNRKNYLRGTRGRFESYSRNQKQWDSSVRYQASLMPNAMIEIIRYNKWPGLRSKLYSQIWQPLKNLIARTPEDFHRS